MADKDQNTTLRIKGTVRKTAAGPSWTWGQRRDGSAMETLKDRISRGASRGKHGGDEASEPEAEEELEECGG